MAEITVVREIDPSARVASDTVVGPFCVIGPNTTIGPGTVLARRVCVQGHTIIGSGNRFEEGCVLGASPQDLKFRGGATFLMIGHRNRFGRAATVHLGTELGGYLTRIGDDNLLLDGVPVAHDCFIDDHTTIGCGVQLAGHIHVQTGAVLGTQAMVHHFVTIGRYCRIGIRTPVRRDVPPFTQFCRSDVESMPMVHGLHEQGILAAKLSGEEEKELRQALHELFTDEAALQTKIEQLVNLGVEGEVAELCRFCQASLQGIYGRQREHYRGKTPPEAKDFLPPELRPDIVRGIP